MSFSSQFIEILDALCERFGIAVDWTSQNVMPYLTDLAARIINYEIWTSVAWIAIAGIVFLITWKLTKNLCKEDTLDDEWCFGWVFRIIIGLICFAVIGCQIFDIIEAVALPEKTLYYFVKGLMKSGS